MQIPYVWLALLLALLNAIGPFAIDAYLPAFPAIEQDLATTPLALQQSLSAYMLPFAVMMLWHGAISDALGRRRIILCGLSLFAFASLVCACASSIHMLWLGRALQGLSSGVGIIVGRAVVRDVFQGATAQRLMSHIAMVFALAPAIAPVIGGALSEVFGWRSIFVMLALLAGIQILAAWRFLPETLPPEKRQSMHPRALWLAYREILGNRAFLAMTFSMALLFAAFFQYVLSAPAFLIQHLHLTSTDFGWMFIPQVCGMLCGSFLSSRLAGNLSPKRTIGIAFMIAGLASLWNLLACYLGADTILTRIPQIALYTLGMNLAFPSMTLIALDMFPARRGTAASCQGCIQNMLMTVVAGSLAPLIWYSTRVMAWSMATMLLLSALSFAAHHFLARNKS